MLASNKYASFTQFDVDNCIEMNHFHPKNCKCNDVQSIADRVNNKYIKRKLTEISDMAYNVYKYTDEEWQREFYTGNVEPLYHACTRNSTTEC